MSKNVLRSSIQTYDFTIACIASAAQYMRSIFQGVAGSCTVWPRWRFLTRARETGGATAQDKSGLRTPLATLALYQKRQLSHGSRPLMPGCRGRMLSDFFVPPPSVLLTACRLSKSAVARPITIIMSSLALVGQLLSGIVSRTGLAARLVF